MTRAMERLWISSARERRRFGSHSYQSPSRFLDEIPEDLLQRHGGERRRPVSGARRISDIGQSDRGGSALDFSYAQEPAGEADGVQLGMRVRHPVFGTGTVMAVMGAEVNRKLKIRFDRVGVKTVMLRYANLEPA